MENVDVIVSFQMPPLFFIMCAMSAMAFVLSAGLWLWRASRGVSMGRDYKIFVWMGQVPAFVCSSVISLMVAIYDRVMIGEGNSVFAEVFVLVFIIVFLSVVRVPNVRGVFQKARFVVLAVSRIFLFGLFCAIGWAVTVGVGYGLYKGLPQIFLMNAEDVLVIAVFVAGALWSVVVALLYMRILKGEHRNKLKGQGIRQFLWPVLCAYFILLFPFLIQNIANSKQWYEMTHAKPMRRADVGNYGYEMNKAFSYDLGMYKI